MLYLDIARKRGRTAQSLYDPTPVVWLAHPGWFVLQHGRVDVETGGRFTRGMTVCDLRSAALSRVSSTTIATPSRRARLSRTKAPNEKCPGPWGSIEAPSPTVMS